MSQSSEQNRANRASHLRWVPIASMKVSPKAQREFKEAHAAELAADFDLEAMGFPVVSLRDGNHYVVDGQHRVEALKMIGWGDQSIQCEVYEGLTEAEEADLFLRRDRRRAIQAFDRFRIAVVAEREQETDIDRIVRAMGLKVSTDQSDTSIAAVGALNKVYRAGGHKVLARDLKILRDSFPGDVTAFRREMIEGLGLVCQRYNGELNDSELTAKFAGLRGGAQTVLRKAEGFRKSTGETQAQCVAAAIVDVANGGRGGKKLSSWWKQ